MTDRELMQQALEALGHTIRTTYADARFDAVLVNNAITALRERLAQPEPAPGYCQHCKQYTIEEPLPAQPEQEPVAGEYATCLEDGERVLIASVLPVGYGGNKTRTVRVVWPDGMDGVYTMFQFARLFSPVGERTTPPCREWVGLTDDDLMELPGFDYDEAQFIAEQKFARAIEAKLREKNS